MVEHSTLSRKKFIRYFGVGFRKQNGVMSLDCGLVLLAKANNVFDMHWDELRPC